MKQENETYYCSRTWLNADDSPSTGSIVCYDGELDWADGKDIAMYVEVADCHGKVRLHKSYQDTTLEFVEKIDKMIEALSKFRSHLIQNSPHIPSRDNGTTE